LLRKTNFRKNFYAERIRDIERLRNDMTDICISNIQRFSLHDGPGIRTTVFLKGCSIRCPWCCNPENLESRPQEYIKDGVKGTYGYEISPDDLYNEVIKDKPFYEGELEDWNVRDSVLIEKLPGGVTFSGGECLLQMKVLEPLLERLNKDNIHTCIETSLYAPTSDLQIALQHIDFFIVDVKILNEEKVREVEKGELDLYKKNFNLLLKGSKPVVLRIPVIGGYTDTEENQQLMCEFLPNMISYANILKIQMIKEHNLGITKYESLHEADPSIPVPHYSGVSDELMNSYKERIQKVVDIPVEICSI